MQGLGDELSLQNMLFSEQRLELPSVYMRGLGDGLACAEWTRKSTAIAHL